MHLLNRIESDELIVCHVRGILVFGCNEKLKMLNLIIILCKTNLHLRILLYEFQLKTLGLLRINKMMIYSQPYFNLKERNRKNRVFTHLCKNNYKIKIL